MKEAVVLIGNREGFRAILSPEAELTDLAKELAERLSESEGLLANSQEAISFEGRPLREEDEDFLISEVERLTGISLFLMMSEEGIREEALSENSDMPFMESAVIRRGSLAEDEVLILEESVVILGDVPKGAAVSSGGSVIVLGTLAGRAWAGSGGEEDAALYAETFATETLRIAHEVMDLSASEFPEGKHMARISGGIIVLT